MWCSKCGTENEDGSNFCKNCGNRLRENLYDVIERAKENDQEALTEIYRYSAPAIYKAVKVFIKDDDTVNDIIQDTYVKAFTRLDQLQNPDRLMPWLKMIATNTAKDWLKKSKPVLFSEMGQEDTSDELSFEESIEDEKLDQNPELAADQKEVSRLVMEILDQLPEDQRLVVGMFYYEEMSVKDIAATLELSENTVKSRLSYARKKIKEQVLELEKQGTRLYSVAPFVFFLYLLRAMRKAPADPADMAAMQQILDGVGKSTGAMTEGQSSGKQKTGTSGASENGNSRPEGKSTGRSAAKSAGKSVAKSAAKNAAGTAARQISIKAVALLAAGTVGIGGITYSIVKHADSLPVLNQTAKTEETETERVTLQETESEAQTELQSETQTELQSEIQTETQSEPVTVMPTETESQSELQTETQSETQSETQTEEPETEISIPENVVAQGSYGDNVQWYLGAEGTLTVNGQGAMADASGDERPDWDAYRDQITKIVIGKGITRIGDGTFVGMGYVSRIEMSDTVTEVGDNAFVGVMPRTADPGIQRSVKFSASLEKIGDYAFWWSNITAIDLPDSVREIGERAFGRLYFMNSFHIGENSQLETIGVQAFEQDGINTPLQSQDINIPSTLRCIKSEAFPAGDYADTVTFSASLQELGLGAFAYGATGLSTIYFQGDAPVITDEQIVSTATTVFPDTTTDVYYPEGNATWNGFDFSKLGVNVTPHSYEAEEKVIAIPQDAVTGMTETESEKADVTEAQGATDAQSLYQAFYEKYVADENLQVIENGWQNDEYDRYTGYTQDMLLAADIDDFGGDGNQELLLIRTRDSQNESEPTEVIQGIKKRINLELYGIDGQEVTLRQTLQYDSSDWNESTAYNIEQIAKQKVGNDNYLYRYAMYHPSAGTGVYDNTIVKITDQELIQEADLQYTTFQGASGLCIVNGEEQYTGNEDADISKLNSVLQPYGLEAYQELTDIPCIVHLTRDEIYGVKEQPYLQDVFRVTNCFRQSDDIAVG